MSTNGRHWLDLDGRACAITGAGGGIGQAIALEFASAGARVALLDRDSTSCSEIVAKIEGLGGTAIALTCDVSDAESVAAAARNTVAAFGGCDVLVNNAGVLRPGRIESIAIADWDQLIRVNLNGYLLCSQEFGRPMLERGAGALVHIASISASQPQPFSGAYSASKAAVAMLSRQIAFEWGSQGIRSNVVSPGLVRTPMSEEFYRTPGLTERRSAVVPMRRIGEPGDIAGATVFLASPRASYINGQELVVDGGFSQTLMSHVPRPGYD